MENPPTVLVKPFVDEEEEKVPEVERFRRAASLNKKFTAQEALSINTVGNQPNSQRVEYENQIAEWDSDVTSFTKLERIGFGFNEDAEEIDTGSGWANVDLLGSGSKNDLLQQ